MTEQKSFVIYKSWATMIANLPTEQAGELIKTICAEQTGQEFRSEDPTVIAILSMIEPKMKEDREKYQTKIDNAAKTNEKRNANCEKRNANGKKRDAKEEKRDGSVSVSVSDTVSDSVTEAVTDSASVSESPTGLDRVPSGASADETAALDHWNSRFPDSAVKIKRAEGETVISHWNSLPEPIPKIKSIGKSGDRPRLLKARLSEYSLAGVVDAIERIKQSDFLQGKEGRNGWTVSFDWFIKPQNFRKVAEGNYDNGVRAPDSRHKTQLDEWREAL